MSNRRFRPPPAQSAPKPRRNLAIGIVAGVGVLAIAGGAIGYGVASSGSSKHANASAPFSTKAASEGQKWFNQVESDYSPIITSLPSVLGTILRWEDNSGKAHTTADVVAQIREIRPNIVLTQEALAKQKPLATAPAALGYFRQAVELYRESFNLYAVATEVKAGALRHQLQLSGTRVRTLGDDVFQLAANLVSEYSKSSDLIKSSRNVNVTYTPAVPDFASCASGPPTCLGEQPGPPLVARPDKGERLPPANSATVSSAAWKATVGHAKVPTASAEAAAIEHGSIRSLGVQATALDRAAATIMGRPYELGAEESRTQLLLGLLTDTEATRAAAAARSVHGAETGQLESTGKALALIGDQLWLPQLGTRATGFPTGLLNPRTA